MIQPGEIYMADIDQTRIDSKPDEVLGRGFPRRHPGEERRLRFELVGPWTPHRQSGLCFEKTKGFCIRPNEGLSRGFYVLPLHHMLLPASRESNPVLIFGSDVL